MVHPILGTAAPAPRDPGGNVARERSACAAASPVRLRGLTSAEASARLLRFGPNAAAPRRRRPVVAFLRRFWGPVPLMLEAALLLEVALGKHVEAAILVALLLSNALVSFAHARRAQDALELLRSKLRVPARVLRDGAWASIPADGLVQGDVVHVRMGDLVPADVRLLEGDVLLDRSMLTGESAPVEARTDDVASAAAVVRRGEATGEVVATGARTAFGKTVSLVDEAQSKSRLEALVLAMVKAFVAIDGLLALVVLAVAIARGSPLVEVVPFVLMVLVASVPVALPAMFTLATAVGSAELARAGVLVTRLAALEEVAGLDVLCVDKTGTLTENALTLVAVAPLDGRPEREVVALAALASDPATQDPIDLAILAAADRDAVAAFDRAELVPFDPATKRAEARLVRGGEAWRVVKGAPAVVAALGPPVAALEGELERL
ncbi:MAG TPA: HAD-IC family P-type ATPase, partial [Minicystis sp.]|nr:HAD-IC family P-type ATPase [Minicystis sp.]